MKISSKHLFIFLLMSAVSLTTFADDYVRGDCNNDGKVNISDVTTLIDYLLTDRWPDEPQETEHEWVDLGLPSGTLWATCNIGANSPEEYGDYFAWGDTEPKDTYNWSTYKWCKGSPTKLTKYCTSSVNGYNGFVDGKTKLDLEDDAAYTRWGALWRTPSYEQQTELRTQCAWTWTKCNGVNGYLVTGLNGNTLFLPSAGYRSEGALECAGDYGRYWSCSLDSPLHAYVLGFDSGCLDWFAPYRFSGLTVRAVRASQN